MRIAALMALTACLAGCVTGGESAGGGGGGLSVTGDQTGGKIPNGVNNTPAAMKAAQAHCASFGRKTFVTRMDAPSDGAMMAFECRQ